MATGFKASRDIIIRTDNWSEALQFYGSVLNLPTTEHEVAWFAQMLTINFAMVVAIYYFLNAAKMTLTLFSFFAYSVGMIVLLGQMLVGSKCKGGDD